MAKGFIIAGERSGVGKTTITLALAQAIINRGLRVQCFKVGPDFIDPSHHALITGQYPRNLDGWMMGRDCCASSFARHSSNADIAIIEGVMGLFDGYDGLSEDGSTAQIAKWLNLPVILVVDGSSLARSAGAVVLGFEQFDPEVEIAGVVFNRVAGANHFDYLYHGVRSGCGAEVLGYHQRGAEWSIPERHLGLVMAGEIFDLKHKIMLLSQNIEKTLNINKVIEIASDSALSNEKLNNDEGSKPPSPVTIGVARDEAFCFYYQDNLEYLQAYGAELKYFSPIHDQFLPEGISGLYLGGGYPEVHAATLSQNKAMRSAVINFCQAGKPVYAECGGLLYLLKNITQEDGITHEMAGLFPAEAKMHSRLQRLGYVEIEAQPGCPFMAAGDKARGHEFHYSDIIHMPADIRHCYRVEKRKNREAFFEGFTVNNVVASYIHLHFASNPHLAERFVELCRKQASG